MRIELTKTEVGRLMGLDAGLLPKIEDLVIYKDVQLTSMRELKVVLDNGDELECDPTDDLLRKFGLTHPDGPVKARAKEFFLGAERKLVLVVELY